MKDSISQSCSLISTKTVSAIPTHYMNVTDLKTVTVGGEKKSSFVF